MIYHSLPWSWLQIFNRNSYNELGQYYYPNAEKRFWSKEKLAHLFHMYNLESVEADFDRQANILPAAYKKADLPCCIPRHLVTEEQEDLLGLLEKLKEFFEGRLGLMPGEPYSLKLKPNAEPVHMRDLFLYRRNISS